MLCKYPVKSLSRDVSINIPVPGRPQSLLESILKQHIEDKGAIKTSAGQSSEKVSGFGSKISQSLNSLQH